MRNLSVTATIDIERPMFVVRQQFGDVAHHVVAQPHRGVRFSELHDDGRLCTYRQTTRVGPVRLRQELRLERSVDGPLVNTITRGQLSGGTITFDFAEVTHGRTRVVAVVAARLTGATSLLGSAVRANVRRALERALREDKSDLEAGDYRPRTTQQKGPAT